MLNLNLYASKYCTIRVIVITLFYLFLFPVVICSRRRQLQELPVRPEVLITGGCGFVGRHFTHKLCQLGYRITIVDNMISESALPLEKWPTHLKPKEEDCGEILFYDMDCRDFFASRESTVSYDLFLHLAAVVGGRAKIEGSPVAVADDLAIDAIAFQWAIDSTNKQIPKNMIYFSSSAAYPVKYQTVHSNILLNESMINLEDPKVDIAKPDLTYGWAKLTGKGVSLFDSIDSVDFSVFLPFVLFFIFFLLLFCFCFTGEYLGRLSSDYYHLNVSIYRPMSGYGEDQHEAYPFKSILLKTIKGNGEKPIEIWSDAVRDFIHIEDIVECVLSSYQHIASASPMNLGTGIATSFSDLAMLMSAELGFTKPKIKILSGMPQGVMYRVGDPHREESQGCKIRISLKEGIRRAIDLLKREKEEKEKEKQEAEARRKGTASSSATTTSPASEGGEDVVAFRRIKDIPLANVSKEESLSYSSYYCMGGSQSIPEIYWKEPREAFPSFPIYDSNYRTCRLHNVCWLNEKLVYFENPLFKKPSLHPFSMNSWKEVKPGIGSHSDTSGNLFHMGTWTPHSLSFHVINEKIPSFLPFDGETTESSSGKTSSSSGKVHYLDGHSNAYNYGHYLLDNVMPHFITSLQFGIPFTGNSRQVFESSCKKFGSQWEKVAHTPIPFNTSMGTFRQACLKKLNSDWSYFFDYPPLYLEYPYSSDICFRTLMIGQSSAYGLKSLDLTRSANIRAFRNYVLNRLSAVHGISLPVTAENIILVGTRSVGHSGGEQYTDLCNTVKHAVKQLALDSIEHYKVVCIVNQDLSFSQEIQYIQRAKIIISVHGTISYMSLFAKDGTQQIIFYDPKENRMKEHNILMYQSQSQIYWHDWTDNEGLLPLLRVTINNRYVYEHYDDYHHTSSDSASSSSTHQKNGQKIDFSKSKVMLPMNGTFIKSHKTGNTIFQMNENGYRVEITGKSEEEIEKLVFAEREKHHLHHNNHPHHNNHHQYPAIVVLQDYEMDDIPLFK
jgi:nucleoside-diphosphate-sugar epimerase